MAIALLLVAFTPLPAEFYGPPLVEEDRVWIEEAEAVFASPVDVNSANLESLLAIPWLSPRVAAAILRARDSLGRFDNLSEVARVPGVDESVLAALAVAARAAPVPVPVQGRLLVTARTDSLAGGGRAVAALSRLTAGGSAWDAAVVAEKDAGETDWADFLGAGVEYRLARARLIAGDYTLASGLGLALSAPGGRSVFAVTLVGKDARWCSPTGRPRATPARTV
ncbi:MAG: helix-hairpin-helix domain-containing protein, partial [bacterium]